MNNAGKYRIAQFPNVLFAFLSLVLLFAGQSRAQIYPDTIRIRAIFYDFHSRANSLDTDFCFAAAMGCLFTPPAAGTVVSGMTDTLLSPDRKPKPIPGNDCKGTAPLYPCACHLPSWYRPSGASGFDTTSCVFACDSGQPNPLGVSRHGSPTNPVWYWIQRNGSSLPSYQNRPGEFIGPNFDSVNNKFANVIIYDSLPFVRQPAIGPSFYQFRADSFYRIDGRGFGNEGYNGLAAAGTTNTHNFAYAMELHYKFVYQPGMKFKFSGNGDLWCFVNGVRKIDLGGVKTAAASDSILLDAVHFPGLVAGNYYNFDLFYAQRDFPGGGLTIQLNTFQAAPANLVTKMIGSDTITAGDTAVLSAKIYDAVGNIVPTASDSIHWTVDTGSNKKAGDVLLSPRGVVLTPPNGNMNDTVRFTARAADNPTRQVHITATYRNSNGSFTGGLYVYVRPGPRHHIVVEPAANLPAASPYADNPLGGASQTITMSTNFLNDTAYTVWRDRCGNFLSFDSSTTWSSGDTSTISVTPGVTSLGSGIIHDRLKDTTGKTTTIVATDGPTGKTDTVLVTTIGRGYDFLQIVKFNPITGSYDSLSGLNPLIDSVGRADTLYAVGHIPNTSIIKRVSVNWFTNLSTALSPPLNQDQWSGYQPSDTGHGKIWITWPGGNGTQADTVRAIFVIGGANSLSIFPKAGAPSGTNQAFQTPPYIPDSVRAGDTLRLYAGVFNNSFWLNKYQDSAIYAQQISWSISSGDTLLNNNNYYTSFRPHRAYRVDTVTARLGTLICQVLVRILPGPANNVAIIGSSSISDSSNVQKLGTLTMAFSDSAAYVYAAVRDAWNNFVRLDTATSWSSSNTSIATAVVNSRLFGQGKITRIADSGTVKIIASDAPLKADTLTVTLSMFSWSGVLISNSGTLAQRLGTLTLAAGTPDTLWAWGTRSGLQPIRQIVNWSNSAGISLSSAAPVDYRWGFSATAAGNGVIRVSLPGTAFTDSVNCTFTAPAASSIVLYHHQAGAPQPVNIFPHLPLIDTLAAEDVISDSIDAKIFNFNGQWMGQFDSVLNADTGISWTLTKLSGPGAPDTLHFRKGHLNYLKAHKAYALYKVMATFSMTGVTLRDSAEIYIKPGVANRLVIERAVPQRTDSLPLIRDQRPDTLRFYANDSTVYAFAVLRDLDSNYVQMCQSTQWTPLNLAIPPAADNSLISAQQGLATEGQGVLTRAPAAVTGRAKVAAVNTSFNYQCDTANVAIEAVAYDSLRIMVINGTDTAVIDSLNMPADKDTNLYVEGKIHATHTWSKGDSVKANWIFIPNTGTSISANNQHKWDFAPSANGPGKIIVSAGGAVPETLGVYIRTGSPAKVVLYGKTSAPDSTSSDTTLRNPALPGPPVIVTVTAGSSFSLAAMVVDRTGAWIASYDNTSFNSYFHWTAISKRGDKFDTLLDAGQTGVAQHFTPRRAYDTVLVVVQFTISGTNKPMDTVLISVRPDAATHMVLEKTPFVAPDSANTCDTLFIPGNSNLAGVYAVLRDRFNNAISADAAISTTGTLNLAGAPDTSIIGSQFSNTPITGLVQAIRKVQIGPVARLYATDTIGYTDSCYVSLLPYSYSALRILTGRLLDTIPNQHDSLFMRNDSIYSLTVQGKRSGAGGAWESIQGGTVWQVSPSLSSVLSGSTGSSPSYTIRPTDTGAGWIRVTVGDDAVTLPDTLKVHFTPGLPVKVAIQIVTPPAQRRAGQPIKAAVILQDRRGNPVRAVIPTYDTTGGKGAFYRDSVGTGFAQSSPFLVAKSDPTDTIRLGTVNTRACRETFTNGVDTATMVLYYAPAPGSDSVHQITLTLKSDSVLTGKSDTFTLQPGPLGLLSIYDGSPHRSTISLPDSLTGDSSITFRSKGVDIYGNFMGDVPTLWHTGGTLDSVNSSVLQSTLFFPPHGIRGDEQGYVYSVYSDSTGLTREDSVYVILRGPAPTIISAVTADTNGNGLLDKIYIQFSKPVVFSADAMALFVKDIGCVSNTVDSTTLTVTGMTGSGTSYALVLKETLAPKVFQTGWMPNITMSGFDKLGVHIGPIANGRLSASDGAGPVVWKVKRIRNSVTTNTQDTVVVQFSEPCRTSIWATGSNTPGTLLNVWTKPRDTFVRDTTVLRGLSFGQVFDSVVTFRMSNDSSLSSPPTHYFSIDTAAAHRLNDAVGNLSPNPNQPEPIYDASSTSGPIMVVPNPMRPRGSKGRRLAQQVPEGQKDLIASNGGTLLQFSIDFPKQSDKGDIKGIVSLYDIAGNLVISDKNDHFATGDGTSWTFDGGGPQQTNPARIFIYWSGANANGSTVAPGVYRFTADFIYPGASGIKAAHIVTRVGVTGAR